MARVGRPERTPDDCVWFDHEETAKGPAGREDEEIVIEHNQRLTDRIDNAFCIGTGCANLPFCGFHFRDIGERENYTLNTVVMSAVR
jgi:hypothetical protein